MKVKEKSKNIIEQLKKVRVEKGITYQQIADETEKNNESVSLSTIKLVFSDKDTHTHDYEKIIKPIARVVLGVNKEHGTEVDSYLAISEYKDVIIEKLEEQIKKLLQQKESSSRKHKEREEMLLQQIDFYKEQIHIKDNQIKRYEENIDRKDAMIRKIILEKER